MHAHKILALALTLIGTQAFGATLNEIAERALAHSPDVQMKMHEYNASGNEQQAARGGLRPRLDLNAYAGRDRYDPEPSVSNYFNHPGTSLELRQLLFDGGAVRSDIRRLGYAKASRYYDLLQTADNVAFESARAYLDVQRNRKMLELAQSNWNVHKQIYDEVSISSKSGNAHRSDLDQVAGRLALAQSNWLTDTNSLHESSSRFERLVGETPPMLSEAPDLKSRLPEEKQMLTEAMQNNPGFISTVYSLRAAQAQTDVRRAANLPTVELRAAAGTERNRYGYDGTYTNGTAQIVMNYNLYRGGSDNARIRQAVENYNIALDAREKTCRDIRQTITTAWGNIRRLRTQLGLLNQYLLSTEKSRDAYLQQFRGGQRSLLDLLDTENELFQARRSYTAALHDLRLAEYQVLSTTHRLLPALGLAPAATDAPDTDEGNPNDAIAQCSQEMPAPFNLDVTAPVPVAPIPVQSPTATPAQVPAPAQAVAGTPEVGASVPSAMTATSPEYIEAQCKLAAKGWAAAWSDRDVEKYLGFYSVSFLPASHGDRDSWKRTRTERLNKGSISVSLSQLSARQTAADSCEVNFRQRYRSSDYNDSTLKRLLLRREGTDWKIVEETTTGTSSGR